MAIQHKIICDKLADVCSDMAIVGKSIAQYRETAPQMQKDAWARQLAAAQQELARIAARVKLLP